MQKPQSIVSGWQLYFYLSELAELGGSNNNCFLTVADDDIFLHKMWYFFFLFIFPFLTFSTLLYFILFRAHTHVYTFKKENATKNFQFDGVKEISVHFFFLDGFTLVFADDDDDD